MKTVIENLIAVLPNRDIPKLSLQIKLLFNVSRNILTLSLLFSLDKQATPSHVQLTQRLKTSAYSSPKIQKADRETIYSSWFLGILTRTFFPDCLLLYVHSQRSRTRMHRVAETAIFSKLNFTCHTTPNADY